MKTSFFLSICLVALSFVLSSCNDDDAVVVTPPEVTPKEFSIRAVGTANATPITTIIEGINQEVTGNAYKLDIFDRTTGERLGMVTDINVAAEAFEDGSMKAENYTVFLFEEDNSTLVLHNFIDMVPDDAPNILDATIPADKNKANVIGGTGRYENATGGSTLSASLELIGGSILVVDFDCDYGIKLN